MQNQIHWECTLKFILTIYSFFISRLTLIIIFFNMCIVISSAQGRNTIMIYNFLLGQKVA